MIWRHAVTSDKSGDVQTIAILREDRDASERRVEGLETEKPSSG
jgi:hypothetical protein